KEIGDYLEFGVCHGSSLLCMHQVLKESEIDNVRLFGFDSFEGLPEVAATDGVWNPGDFYAGFEKVKNYLTKKGIDWNRVTLTKGWFKDTLNLDFIRKYKIKKASIIMIDCDIYQSTKEALNFCKNLIKDKTIIFFDDWNSSGLATKNLGEKRAFDEFLNENPQFTAQKFDSYSYQGNPNGEIYLVSSS
ncbi:MAG: TylF/MycF/NovP-related O-methyltransferase, partial [Bacteroidota bacterium]